MVTRYFSVVRVKGHLSTAKYVAVIHMNYQQRFHLRVGDIEKNFLDQNQPIITKYYAKSYKYLRYTYSNVTAHYFTSS